ncbi:hypothetical protein IE81DRAFT_206091 [Ceraceosorus guamensis]|uniref:Six-hairpin glycosidase n=1 Tax=Ceraceosorus guamensis TaxID=1522189 RepID=A0A316VUY5_9BASI|nr:hypothetical protein IE81DRAFT_206091 [Ceraceosorus guamensis]PWN40718.1 hypothetical protein IE81DRAFT_206091 [Ceraceosorus guamensis]
MAFSLVVDDVTLILLLLITITLSLTLYISSQYQPSIHPLILSRQADVSQVHGKGESPKYRNANSPAGFNLAERPRPSIVDVPAIVAHGVTVEEEQAKKSKSGEVEPIQAQMLYGREIGSVGQLRDQAAAFAAGLVKSVHSSDASFSLAVCAHNDSLESLTALIAASHQTTIDSTPFYTLVTPAGGEKMPVLPSGVGRVAAIFTTLEALDDAAQISPDDSALLILPTQSDAEVASGRSKRRVVSFEQVLSAGAGARMPTFGTESERLSLASRLHSHYLLEGHWVPVTNEKLTAGLVAQLGFFPGDAIPNAEDHIFVERHSSLLASATPAGLVLALLAVFTRASLTVDALVSSPFDSRPAVTGALTDAKPTLLYVSMKGASSLSAALTERARRTPLAGPALRLKLGGLRHGALSQTGLADRLVFDDVRQALGLRRLRSALILGDGNAPQSLLDTLRGILGVAVMQAWLPSNLLTSSVTGVKVAATAPLSATHSLDLQAFADHSINSHSAPYHSGPPAVSIELKLVESAAAKEGGYVGRCLEKGREGDWSGEVYVAGTTLAGANEESEYCSSKSMGTVRPNGTLVVLQDALKTPLANVGTLTGKWASTLPSRRKTSQPHKWSAVAPVGVLAMMLFCALPTATAVNVNSTNLELARLSMLVSQRASWEQGTAQSALLELDAGGWSVFTAERGGPPYSPRRASSRDLSNPPLPVMAMSYHSVSAQDGLGKLCSRISGDENRTAGSALDPASCLEGVLVSAFASGQISGSTLGSGYYAQAARRMIDYLLDTAPRTSDGAISHRASSLALWSDAIYMLPPALASYGLITSNQSMLQEAYDQIRLYRDGLLITSGQASGMWNHINDITTPNASDLGAWLTGQGWAVSGMSRVLAAFSHSNFDLTTEKEDIAEWAKEIMDASYSFADPSTGLIRNYANETDEFLDAAGSALLAAGTFRIASITGDRTHVASAEKIYQTTSRSLNNIGSFGGRLETVDALGFTFAGETSPEAVAAQMLLAAARRDHTAGNVTGLNGPGTGFEGGASSSAHLPSTLVALLAVACASAAILL